VNRDNGRRGRAPNARVAQGNPAQKVCAMVVWMKGGTVMMVGDGDVSNS
jgi:hypothetical protein